MLFLILMDVVSLFLLNNDIKKEKKKKKLEIFKEVESRFISILRSLETSLIQS